jgi:hypothetical protein
MSFGDYAIVFQVFAIVAVVRLLAWLRPWRYLAQLLRGHRG